MGEEGEAGDIDVVGEGARKVTDQIMHKFNSWSDRKVLVVLIFVVVRVTLELQYLDIHFDIYSGASSKSTESTIDYPSLEPSVDQSR